MRPDLRSLEARLGIPLGKTLTALILKAYEVDPERPSRAFWAAGIYLPWIDPDFGGTVEELRLPSTPADVLPIIETGGDLQHFGFLMRRGRFCFLPTSTDKRSIVNVVKDRPPAEPFTRNLTGLLCVAATASLPGVTREDLMGGRVDVATGDEFERASRHLLSIRGVERVKDARPLLDLRELTFSSDEAAIPPFEPPPRTPGGWDTQTADNALLAAKRCADHGFPRDAVEFCEIALGLIANGVLACTAPPAAPPTLERMVKADLLLRTHLLRVASLASVNDAGRGHAAVVAAVDAWAALPFVHATHWAELRSVLARLGVDDPELGRRIEGHEREASSDSL